MTSQHVGIRFLGFLLSAATGLLLWAMPAVSSPHDRHGGGNHHRPQGHVRPHIFPIPTIPDYRAPDPRPYQAPYIDLRPRTRHFDRHNYNRRPEIRYYRESRISCDAAKNLLKQRGYSRISSFDCSGGAYGFHASLKGVRYQLTIDAEDGGIILRARR